MVAPRLLARVSRKCVIAVRRAGAARFGVAAAAAEPFAGSFSSIRVPHMLNQNLRYSTSIFQRFGFSSVLPQQSDKADGEPSNESSSSSGSEKAPEEGKEDLDLSKEDLVKLVHEKDGLLKSKDDEIKVMKEKVLRSYAEMENVIAQTKRESENSKKYANFSKSLLDVADNLARASSVVKENFSKIRTSKDSAGAVPLLKTLLEGVDMTDKQLAEVFKKFGVEKFDPLNEKFDPNRHCAIFQIPDGSKPAGTVASVVKVGYMLHDRVLRPAEVGVTEGGATEEADQPEQRTAGD
ncbi:grpE protein homolog 2, mitochondrial-like isoform X2 [Phragmites australis]|uniref:grpE protein homolog 2, mitochondrial-like isoform X2 n=1 Tax=Phragmites australis TaxID=29695 RepID=UPI002D7892CF|nr:grpE protein homolog 2, mitochondrial-like isoform X2 [Phragmites australis]